MANKIRRTATLALLSGLISAQSTTSSAFFDHARIVHKDSRVTVVANDSTPLFQAISAVRLEYGWQVNWESAPGYSRFDTVDDTGPKWRAAHPDAKGVTRPAGGLFTGTFPEPAQPSRLGDEELALASLVREYNATGNPGKYSLRSEPVGQFSVVGTAVRDETGALQQIPPLLDTPISLTKAPRTVYESIGSLLGALQSATGKKVLFASASSSLFMNTQATIGGEKSAARQLLKQALAGTKRDMQYDLFFNPDVPVYILNVSPVMRQESDGQSGERIVPTGPSPKP